MARPKKKGTSGAAKNFITRTQAVRKLQISLPDFRRLCIFKGIYPREPRNKKKAAKNSTPAATFYYTRDIQYLLHEPLLQKFRDQKALAKKIGRLLGRNEAGDAARAERNLAPRISLDHVVKERYPTFVDALRDLDDCLCMLYLFASLPSTDAVPSKTIALCQRLVLEFEHYLIVSHSVRKSFLSIKGIYYQATIQGEDILWLVPYKFVQRMTGDIDFRIMGTFVEFYTTLMGFVNFRLYTSVGLVYPPKFDAQRVDQGAELGAFQLEGRAIQDADTAAADEQADPSASTPALDAATTAKAQQAANAISAAAPSTLDEGLDDDDDAPEPTIDEFHPAADDADILPQPEQSSSATGTLFSQHTFYLGRETPRAPLEFLLKAFGSKRIGWPAVLGEGAWTTDETDPRITHQVVDRPAAPVSEADDDAGLTAEEAEAVRERIRAANLRIPGRTYIQPQWVWDCVNAGKLLRPDLYAPGATLPPHLSPWAKPKRGAYDPTAPLEKDDLEEEAGEEEESNPDDEELQGLMEDIDPADADDALSDASEAKAAPLSQSAADQDSFDGFSEEEDEEEDATSKHQRELEAEAKGLPAPAPASKKQQADKKRKAAERAKKAQADELDRQKMMLPRRKRKLLDKMLYSNAQTDAEADKLRQKRRRLEKERGGKR